MKMHLRRDDEVVVLSGAHKGKRGKVLRVDAEKNRVVVEGINVRRVTVRRSQANPNGGFSEKACPIHASNVMKAAKFEARQQKHAAAQAK